MFRVTKITDTLLPIVANVKPKLGQFETRLLVYRFFINLTPFIPLSFKGEGETKKEGLRPSYTPQKIGFLYLSREE